MTARTLYALPGPLPLTPSQLGRSGRFKVTSRTLETVTAEVWTDAGADVVNITNPGDSIAFPLLGLRAIHLSASGYPANVLLESTELPLELDCAVQVGNTAADPMVIHVAGGGGGGGSATLLDYRMNGLFGNPCLSIGLTIPPGPGLDYSCWITDGIAGATVSTWGGSTASTASTAGDGTGLDRLIVTGSSFVLHNLHTYYIWAEIPVISGNLGYSTGQSIIHDDYPAHVHWPPGILLQPHNVGPSGPIAAGVPFLIGSFTAYVT